MILFYINIFADIPHNSIFLMRNTFKEISKNIERIKTILDNDGIKPFPESCSVSNIVVGSGSLCV